MSFHPPTRKHSPLERGLSLVLSTLMLSGMPLHAWAAPTGEQVVHGQATFNRNGNTTTIEAGNNAIINYQGFDIGVAETVRFVQPAATARVLNRVMSLDPTQIDGSLLANGQVYIINPAGVFFGDSAVVNVGGLIAAAGELTNENFLANIDSFTNLTGPVENFGTIRANMVGLLGQTVANHGAIIAPDGLITMVAGDNVILTKFGEHIRVRVMGDPDAAMESGTGVTNTGTLDAGPNGEINLVAGDVYSVAVAHSGSAVARRMHAEGAGLVDVAGDVTASDVSLDGGAVSVTGTIDASGAEGGGSVMIGGQRTRVALVGESATIMANAIRRGNGGSVIVAASDIALVFGQLQAKGGAEGGNGGFIETSAKYLEVTQAPDVSAPAGDGGHWLIDPSNVEIVDNATGADDLDPLSPNFTPDGLSEANTTISDHVIEAALNTGADVTINTFNPDEGAAGNITVSEAINASPGAGASLTLDAANNINVNASITAAGANGMDVNLNADSAAVAGDGGLDGTGGVFVNADVRTNGGNFTATGVGFELAGGASVTTTGVPGTASGNATVASRDADITVDGTIDTSGSSPGGDITLAATGAGVISVATTLDASGGAPGGPSGDVTLVTETGTITTADILARGAGGAGVPGGDGGDVVAISTGGGAITLGNVTATGGGSAGAAGGAGGSLNVGTTGAIQVAAVDLSGGTAAGGSGGAGGDLTIVSSTSITTGAITSTGGHGVGGSGGAGGDANLISTGGNVTTGAINLVGGLSTVTSAGAGGNLSILGNALTGTTIDTSGGNATGASGDGGASGNVTLGSVGNPATSLDYDTITADGGSSVSGTGGAGGDVTLVATDSIGGLGAINARGGDTVSGSAGAGGAVSLASDADITLSDAIDASGGNASGSGTSGAGGSVTLVATGGEIEAVLARIDASGGDSSGGDGGAGGVVSIATTEGDVTFTDSDIDATGGNSLSPGGSGDGGAGGQVNVATTTGNIFFSGDTSGEFAADSDIDASGGIATGSGDGGDGGLIVLSSDEGNIQVGQADQDFATQLLARGGAAQGAGAGGAGGRVGVSTGADGTVALTGLSVVIDVSGGDSVAGPGGNGGDAVVTAADADITFTDAGIDATGGSSTGGGATDHGGAGGSIAASTTGTGDVLLSETIAGGEIFDASGGDAVGGHGGAGGTVSLAANAAGGAISGSGAYDLVAGGGSSEGGDGGHGGEVTLSADQSVTPTNVELFAQGGDSTDGEAGDGGSVDVTSANGSISFVAANTSGGDAAGAGDGGNGGPIDLSGDGLVSVATLTADGGTSVDGAGGDGGDVSVDSTTALASVGSIFARGGDSTSGAGGQGGEVTATGQTGVTANTLQAHGGSSAGAGPGGDGGTVQLSSAAGTVLSSTRIDTFGGSSQQGDGGNGGAITIAGDAVDVEDVSSFGGDSQQGSGGNAGIVGITTTDGLLQVGTIDTSGGNAFQDGDGGDAAEILLESAEGVAPAGDNTIQVVGDLLADGGRSFGSGQGGQGADISLHVGASGVASRLLVTGKADSSGGDSQEADGGDAGNVFVNVGDGDVLWTPAADGIAIDTRGGSSLAGNTTGNGGEAGTIDVVTGSEGTAFNQDIVFGAPGTSALITSMGGSSGPIPANPVNQAGNGSGRGTDGADVSMVAGQLGAAGTGGDIAVVGEINSSGGTGANVGGGTDGGNVSLLANNGAVSLTGTSPGIVTSGTSSLDGDGGDAGTVEITALGAPGGIFLNSADIEAQGGRSFDNGDGGLGGDVTLEAANPIVAASSEIHTEGGTAFDGNGGDAGAVAMTAGTNGILLTGSPVFADGGGSVSNGDGGDGGTIELTARGPIRLTAGSHLRSNGGGSTDGNGGDGNDVTVFSFGSNVTLDASNVLARGGNVFAPEGENAGDGGNATLLAEQFVVFNNGSDLLLEGGSTESTTNGTGGDGGDATVIARTQGITIDSGTEIRTLGGDVAGNGNSGNAGDGGDVQIGSVDPAAFPLPTSTLFVDSSAEIDTSGGHVTGVGASGNGGNAGSVLAEATGFVFQQANVTAEGGDIDPVLGAGSTGDGGQGGPVTFHSTSNEVEVGLATDISTRGGDALSGNGGDGGDVNLLGDGGDVTSNPNILTRGGHSTDPAGAGNGGNGGMVMMAAGDGDVIINNTAGGRSISTVGGDAAGTGQAGNGGDVMLSAEDGSIDIGQNGRTDVTTNGGNDGAGAGGTAGDISAIADDDIRVNGDLTALPGNGGAGSGFIALVSQEGGTIEVTDDDASPRIHAGDFVLIDAGDPVSGLVILGDEVDVVAKDHVDQPAADKLAAKGVDVTGLVAGAKGIKIRNADVVQLGDNVDLIAENGAISVIEGVGGIELTGVPGTNNLIDGNGDFYTELAPITDTNGVDSLTINDEGDIFVAQDSGTSIVMQNDLFVNVDDDGDGSRRMTIAGQVQSDNGDLTFTGTHLNDDMVFGGDVRAPNGTVEMRDFDTVQLAKQGGTTQVVQGENVYFNAPDSQPLGLRGSVPTYATVARTQNGNLLIQASEDVRFGHNEKLSVPGNAQVVAGDDVAIGDVAALDVFVNAGDQITINTRNPGNVEVRGGGFEGDTGTDIVGNHIAYVAPGGIVTSGQGNSQVVIGTPTALTDGPPELNAQLQAFVESGGFQIRQIFPDGRNLTTGDFYRNGVPGDLPGSDVQGSRTIQSSVVLDITPTGSARGNVGENFPGVTEASVQNPDRGVNQAAVSEAPLRENAVLAFLECGSDKEDRDDRDDEEFEQRDDEGLVPDDVQECEEQAVGDARANSDAAEDAKEAYRELFGSYAGREALVAQRKAELATALDAGDTRAPVLGLVRKLFGAVETMGMSEESMASFQMAVITAIQPTGRSAEEVWALLAASYE